MTNSENSGAPRSPTELESEGHKQGPKITLPMPPWADVAEPPPGGPTSVVRSTVTTDTPPLQSTQSATGQPMWLDSIYPSGEALPEDLARANKNALYLLETASEIVSILAVFVPGSRVSRAVALASEMRGKIKEECESAILGVTHEITDANKQMVKVSCWKDEFANAHRASLFIGAVVCDLIWTGTYRKRGMHLARELFSLPLTVEDVTTARQIIRESLAHDFKEQDWQELKGQLRIEIARTAHARSLRKVEAKAGGGQEQTSDLNQSKSGAETPGVHFGLPYRRNPYARRNKWIALQPGSASAIKKELERKIALTEGLWKTASIPRINAIRKDYRDRAVKLGMTVEELVESEPD